MNFFNNLKSLPVQTKKLLGLGVIIALVIALPLFIWGITTQRFDIRKRAATGEPTPTATPTPVGTVNWTTQWASFSASDFQIQVPDGTTNGKTFRAQPSKSCNTQTGATICLNSNPPGPGYNGLHYMTLEVTWFEYDTEMRMFIYLYSDGVRWWSNEIRVYNGQPNPEWVYYYGKFFDSPVGQPFTQSQQFVLNAADPVTGGPVSLRFANVRFFAFQNYFNVTPTPTIVARCNSSCNYSINPPVGCISGLSCIPNQPNLAGGSGVCRNPRCPDQPNCICTITPTPTPPISKCDQPCGGSPRPAGYPNSVCATGLICKTSGALDAPGTCRNPNCPDTPGCTCNQIWYQGLKFKVKLAGVENDTADGAKIAIRIRNRTRNTDYATTATLHYTENGVYQASIGLKSVGTPAIPVGDGYTIYLKGEKHISKKLCTYTQTARCVGDGKIYIGATNNPDTIDKSPQVFEITALPLEPGDLPTQDGQADSADFAKINNLLTKSCSALTASEKYTADLDYNGCINVRDAFLMRKTLETKYDEE